MNTIDEELRYREVISKSIKSLGKVKPNFERKITVLYGGNPYKIETSLSDQELKEYNMVPIH